MSTILIPSSVNQLTWAKVSHIQNIPEILNRNLLFPESASSENYRSIKDCDILVLHSSLTSLQKSLGKYKPTLCQRIIDFIIGRLFSIWRLRRSLPTIISYVISIAGSILKSKLLENLEKEHIISLTKHVCTPSPQQKETIVYHTTLKETVQVQTIDTNTIQKIRDEFLQMIKTEIREATAKMEQSYRVSFTPTPPRKISPPQTMQSPIRPVNNYSPTHSLQSLDDNDFVSLTPLQPSPRKISKK